MDINKSVNEKIDLLNQIRGQHYLDRIPQIAEVIIASIHSGGKIMTAGNGGSAADAQHFTGELIGRFLHERGSYAAVSLIVDPVVMTCISNDYGYDCTIARQVEGIGKNKDVLFTISTSGHSKNMINAIETAKKMGITTISLVGKDGGEMAKKSDYCLIVPSDNVPRIQEIHTYTVHLLCEIIEEELIRGVRV